MTIEKDAVHCLINNVPVTTSRTFNLVDPHNPKQILYSVYAAGPDDADKAVASAWAAFKTWKLTSFKERAAIFSKALTLFREKADQLLSIRYRETTATHSWAYADLNFIAIPILQDLISHADFLENQSLTVKVDTRDSRVFQEPYGVVFGMAPWNAAFVLGLRAICAPIMAGNTVILKTSEFCPQSHLAICEILIEAGLPPGVLNVLHVDIQGAPTLVERIISNNKVRKVNFTGSSRVGRIIHSICANYLKPITLELGGKAPVIILENADLDLAIEHLIWSGFSNAGQVCMSADRLLLHHSIADSFLGKLKIALQGVKGVCDESNGREFRGLFSHRALENYHSLINDAIKKGAKVCIGELHPIESNIQNSNLAQPLVLDNVTPDMHIYKEEIFGPALIVLRFNDVEQAINIANDSQYGLSASVYTRDIDIGIKICQEIESGAVHLNGPTIHDVQEVPHGGVKSSGFGRFNGKWGLLEFSQTKTITINTNAKVPPAL